MQNFSDIDRFADIAGTGEVITVIYKGGSAPGTKRKILVRKMQSESMEVVEYPRRAPKTYLVEKTTVVHDDHTAPWMPDDAGRSVVVVPEEYFANWCYEIRESLFPALGVTIRTFIDKEKSAVARDAAIRDGMPKAEATRRIRITFNAHAVSIPANFDFHEGDIFYRRDAEAESKYLQVLGVKTSEFDPLIEVHQTGPNGSRLAFHVSPQALADTLRTGQPFSDSTRIHRAQSLSESLRFSISDPEQR
jgi:hypothetical protein